MKRKQEQEYKPAFEICQKHGRLTRHDWLPPFKEGDKPKLVCSLCFNERDVKNLKKETPESSVVNDSLKSTTRENLKKLAKSFFLSRWVGEHNGQWNHQDWLSLIAQLEKSEFWPLDPDQVGRLLETNKGSYLERKAKK
jgi:hypothetical protein